MSDAGEDSSSLGDSEPNHNLPAQIEHIIELVPEDRRSEAVMAFGQYIARYSGPVPHSSEMMRYKEIDPSFPERFVRMAEKQAEHRQKMETEVVRQDFQIKRWGQTLAIIAIFIVLAFACGLAWLGATTAAAIVGGTTVVGVVGIFVTGRILESRLSEDAPSD